MNTSKIILIIAGLFIILGLGSVAFRLQHKTTSPAIIQVPEDQVPPVSGENPAPTENPKPWEISSQFGKPVTLVVDGTDAEKDTALFPDGLGIALKEINDSRCKPNVQCIWAGNISAVFGAYGGTIKSATATDFELTIPENSVAKSSVKIDGYEISMKSATETNATIVVVKNNLVSTPSCYVGGCSGEVCSDQKNAVSSCIYRAEYACYKTATCERQMSGQCGWTQTSALKSCLTSS